MSKEEFVLRWRCRLAGGLMYGTLSDLQESPLQKASNALTRIPKEVEEFLGLLWNDMAPKQEEPKLPDILPRSVPAIDQALRQATLTLLKASKGTVELERAWKAITVDQRRACQDDLQAMKDEAAKYDAKPNGTVKK